MKTIRYVVLMGLVWMLTGVRFAAAQSEPTPQGTVYDDSLPIRIAFAAYNPHSTRYESHWSMWLIDNGALEPLLPAYGFNFDGVPVAWLPGCMQMALSALSPDDMASETTNFRLYLYDLESQEASPLPIQPSTQTATFLYWVPGNGRSLLAQYYVYPDQDRFVWVNLNTGLSDEVTLTGMTNMIGWYDHFHFFLLRHPPSSERRLGQIEFVTYLRHEFDRRIVASPFVSASVNPSDTHILAGLVAPTGDTDQLSLMTIDWNGHIGRTLADQVQWIAPRWSPDGQWIAFAQSRKSLRIVNTTTLETRDLTTAFFPETTDETANSAQLDSIWGWTPDQSLVFFSTYTPYTPLASANEDLNTFYAAHTDGSGILKLAEYNGFLRWLPCILPQDNE